MPSASVGRKILLWHSVRSMIDRKTFSGTLEQAPNTLKYVHGVRANQPPSRGVRLPEKQAGFPEAIRSAFCEVPQLRR